MNDQKIKDAMVKQLLEVFYGGIKIDIERKVDEENIDKRINDTIEELNKALEDSRLFYLKQLEGLEEVIDNCLFENTTLQDSAKVSSELADAIRKMMGVTN